MISNLPFANGDHSFLRGKLMIIFLFAAIIFSSSRKTIAQPGAIDGSFGDNGVVLINTAESAAGNCSALQADGKIITVGYDSQPITWLRWFMVRCYSDGSIDNSFGPYGNGTDGQEFSTYGGIYSVAIQPDGKIVVAGEGDVAWILARFNSGGGLDATFSDDGWTYTDDAYMSNLLLQADGKIVFGEDFPYTDSSAFYLRRYTNSGKSDSSFGNNGIVCTAIRPHSMLYCTALQSDGKIIAAGSSSDSTNDSFTLARYNTNGSLDSSFGDNGIVITDLPSFEETIYSIALQPDGKIIVAGNDYFGAFAEQIILARYNIDGGLDSSFGTSGIVNTSFLNPSVWPPSVALQSDGKIVVLAEYYYSSNSTNSFALGRYYNDGSVDSSFGVNGVVHGSDGFQMLIQPDGKILVTGYTDPVYKTIVLTRYLSTWNVGIINLAATNHEVFIYPNPITQNAMLSYTLQNDETVTIRLLDLKGKILKTFVENETEHAGEHKKEIAFPDDLASGSYLVTITSSSGGSVSIKVVK